MQCACTAQRKGAERRRAAQSKHGDDVQVCDAGGTADKEDTEEGWATHTYTQLYTHRRARKTRNTHTFTCKPLKNIKSAKRNEGVGLRVLSPMCRRVKNSSVRRVVELAERGR